MAHRSAPGTRRWYDAWSRYLAFFAVVLTLLTTSIVYFATEDDLGGVKDLVTVCIGLLGTVVALQLEILFRVAERSHTREAYNRLLEGIEDFPDLLPLASDALLASVATLEGAKTPQIRSHVYTVLDHARARLQELSQGRLRVDGSDNTLVLERFSHATTLLQGTTDEKDTAWWKADDGRRFLQLNADLIARGVTIERIWFLDRAPDAATITALDEHRALKVRVFVIRSDRRDLDRRLLANLSLMDGSFLQQDVPNKEGHAVEYLYSENPADLERAKRLFAQLKAMASEYTGADSLGHLFPGTSAGDDVGN